MVLNPENVCPECGKPIRGTSKTCRACQGTPKAKGRPPKNSDEEILAAVGKTYEVNKLMQILDLKSKSSLMIRLRRLRDEGLVTIIEGKRCDGYTIGLKGETT